MGQHILATRETNHNSYATLHPTSSSNEQLGCTDLTSPLTARVTTWETFSALDDSRGIAGTDRGNPIRLRKLCRTIRETAVEEIRSWAAHHQFDAVGDETVQYDRHSET